jgi:hypothetical protein
MKSLSTISESLDSINISKIVEYSNKIGQITSLSQGAASVCLQDFIVAYDLASYALSISMKCEADAKTALDSAKSEAYFDRAPDYLTKNSTKDTSEARKKYEEIDEEVVQAKDIYSRAEATTQLLKNKLMTFRYTYEAIKKMYFNNEGKQMPWEGM